MKRLKVNVKKHRFELVISPVVALIEVTQKATARPTEDRIPPCCQCWASVTPATSFKLDEKNDNIVCEKCKQQSDACGNDQVKKEAHAQKVFMKMVAPLIEGKIEQKQQPNGFHVLPGRTVCAACATLIGNAHYFNSMTPKRELWHICVPCCEAIMREMIGGFRSANKEFAFRGKEYTDEDVKNEGIYS